MQRVRCEAGVRDQRTPSCATVVFDLQDRADQPDLWGISTGSGSHKGDTYTSVSFAPRLAPVLRVFLLRRFLPYLDFYLRAEACSSFELTVPESHESISRGIVLPLEKIPLSKRPSMGRCHA